MSFLEVHNASYIYSNGVEAVSNISFQFELGEKVAIIGQNGAGKTTTVKLFNGLLKPTSGSIIIDGINSEKHSTATIARTVGYVFQNPDDQIFNKTVYEEIALSPKILGMSADEISSRVHSAADQAGLTEFLQTNPYDLPFQMRKFIAIAAVLAMDPQVYIFDEPTAGQDRQGNEILKDIINMLAKKGKLVITISHDMDFVIRNFSRIIVMAQKEKIFDGKTSEIFWNQEILDKAALALPPIGEIVKELALESKALLPEDLVEFLIN